MGPQDKSPTDVRSTDALASGHEERLDPRAQARLASFGGLEPGLRHFLILASELNQVAARGLGFVAVAVFLSSCLVILAVFRGGGLVC